MILSAGHESEENWEKPPKDQTAKLAVGATPKKKQKMPS